MEDSQMQPFGTDRSPVSTDAAETLGPLNESSITFFSELGRKIASISGDNREPSFLFQSISITIQHFNSILLHNSFSSDEE